MSNQPVETISSDDGPEQPPRRSTLGRVGSGTSRATALTAVLSLVLAGGVATAAYRSLQQGPRVESQLPASTFAVAVADLSAPGDALGQFADHFPGSPTLHGSGSPIDRLLTAMFRSTTDPHVDYARDVQPWLGDQVAVAGWVDGSKPKYVAVFRSTDDGAARSALTRLTSGSGTAAEVHDGWVVLSDSTADVDAARSAAATAPLTGKATYADDVAALPGHEAMTAWVDGAAAVKAVQSLMGAGAGASVGSPFGFPSLSSGMSHEREAVGVHVSSGYLQVDLRTVGGSGIDGTSSDLLTHLPSGTIAAAEVGDAGHGIGAFTKALLTLAPLSVGISCAESSSGTSGIGLAPVPSVVPAVPALPRNVPHRRAILRRLHREERAAQRQAAGSATGSNSAGGSATGSGPAPAAPPSAGSTDVGPSCTQDPAPDPLAAISKATGLDLPGDAQTLLGDGAVVSYGGLNLGGAPSIALRTHPSDAAAARAVATKVAAAVAAHSPLRLTVRDAGSDLVLATSQTYADEVAADGSLGQQDRFAAALDGLPSTVASAGYVDLSRVWPTVGLSGDAVHHLEALGFWSKRSGDVTTGQLRLLVG